MKISRIEIFKTLPTMDKLLSVLFVLTGIALFANGLYLVGTNGLLLVLGAIILYFATEIHRNAEIRILTESLGHNGISGKDGKTMPVGAAANTNDDLIRSIIEKKKKNRQQSLLDSLMDNSGAPERDEAQARADHEELVEMARKKQEAMRTAVSGPPADPKVAKKVMDEQKAYIDELMKPTIIPQRDLAEKADKKD